MSTVPPRLPSRADFQLEPGLVFLNHGSFGAVPVAVEREASALRAAMERNPVEWLGRRSDELLGAARQRLAGFLGASPDDVVFFPNPTTAVNMVVRSLRLSPGDEVLTTDHEYGACVRTWAKWCGETGTRLVAAPIALPVADAGTLVDHIWSHVTERTRVLFISHLTSATALVLPVAALCERARQHGILTIVDGAHVPAHLDLDLGSLGADVYTGALHKWLCAPKGCSFLYATPQVQEWLQPLVVSWGWESDDPSGSRFVDHHQWQGTRDLTPFLAVDSALRFAESFDWAAMRAQQHRRAVRARDAIDAIAGAPPVCPGTTEWIGQMAVGQLPVDVDTEALMQGLLTRHRIEARCHRWGHLALLRVSCAAYTTDDEVDALIRALPAEIERSRP
ncbi:MAG: aminotransferase class V-fold PLP-dependent enzyme [Ilumatobacteraceae bacterium]